MKPLLDKRLILLSGKGGVGKTTIALALGLAAASLKKKTLIVEMNSTERVAPYFGLKEIGHKEIPLSPYLTGINLNPHDCFEEYVLMQIKFKAIFDTFINNRFVTAFLNAVPGLNELLMIGKIFDLERQAKRFPKKTPLYDLIIVDGPATGHGVSAFEVPSIVSRAVRVGPMKIQADRLVKLLTDPIKTVFCAVTIPEEMPVVETGELLNSVKKKLQIPIGPIFLNNVVITELTQEETAKIEKKMPERSDPLFPYFAYARLEASRAHLHAYYGEELRKQNPDREIITVPHVDGEIRSEKDLRKLEMSFPR